MIDICLLYIFGTSIMALVSELHVLYFPQIMGGSSPISFGTLLYVLLLILWYYHVIFKLNYLRHFRCIRL